jgi:hypothetical protein
MESIDKFIPEGITKHTNEMISLKTKTKISDKRYQAVIFNTGGGGLGKTISSTAILHDIQEKYGSKTEIHVITPHIDVFKSNPHIHKVWHTGATVGLYDLLLKTYSRVRWLQAEPYFYSGYIGGENHLINAWRTMLGLENKRTFTPELFLTDKELKEGKRIVRGDTTLPTIVFQVTGGAVQQNQDGSLTLPKMFERNLPPQIMQNVIAELHRDYHFIQIAKKGQPLLNGATHLVDYDIRALFAVIKECNIIVCIDSFVHHAAAALNKKAIVLWAATNPSLLGYKLHENLYRNACPTPLCGRPNSFLCDTDPNGGPWSCPYGTPCSDHDEDNIIRAIQEY